jgi:hypothetical protein
MNKSQFMLKISLILFVLIMWVLALNFGIVPAHSRDPLGTQSTPLP